MEQSPSSEANSHSARQELSYLLWNQRLISVSTRQKERERIYIYIYIWIK